MDPLMHAEGTAAKHLIQVLKDAFVKHCIATKKPNVDVHPDARPAAEFWEFAAEYLDTHRTVENWPADQNIGVRLANNVRCLIHPPTAAGDGQMQDSGAVQVTEGLSQPGQEGVSPTTVKRII